VRRRKTQYYAAEKPWGVLQRYISLVGLSMHAIFAAQGALLALKLGCEGWPLPCERPSLKRETGAREGPCRLTCRGCHVEGMAQALKQGLLLNILRRENGCSLCLRSEETQLEVAGAGVFGVRAGMRGNRRRRRAKRAQQSRTGVKTCGLKKTKGAS